MTTPDQILEADIRETMQAVARATGVAPKDIVRGTGRAAGHVAARHAVFWLLRSKGHGMTAIANAFGHSRTGVYNCLARVGIHGKVWDAIEAARASLKQNAALRK